MMTSDMMSWGSKVFGEILIFRANNFYDSFEWYNEIVFKNYSFYMSIYS